MNTYLQIGGCILALVLLFGSMSPLSGSQTIRASDKKIMPSEISQSDSVFQTSSNPCSIDKHSMLRTTRGNIDDVIFSQRPYLPTESWTFRISSSLSSPAYLCQDNFFGLSEVIDGIDYFGICALYSGMWISGDPTGLKFQVIFYEDNAGQPGSVVQTFSDLEPTAIDTGQSYSGFEMYHWSIILGTYVDRTQGWVSIQNTYHPSNFWFLWAGSPEGDQSMYQQGSSVPHVTGDSAFNLSGCEWPQPPNPDITVLTILEPQSGPAAAAIAPIICIKTTDLAYFPLTVQITSSTLEYDQTLDVAIAPWDPYISVAFPDWTPAAWNKTSEDVTIGYTIIASAFLPEDPHPEDNTKTKMFNLTFIGNNPPSSPTITGPHYGTLNTEYMFSASAVTDPEGDYFYCLWDWGDASTEWQGMYANGTTTYASHAWSAEGTYTIRVKPKDQHGWEGNWSAPFTITVYQAMRKAFIFGSYRNMTVEGNYVILTAVNIRMLTFNPLAFIHEKGGEKVALSRNNIKVKMKPHFILGIAYVWL